MALTAAGASHSRAPRTAAAKPAPPGRPGTVETNFQGRILRMGKACARLFRVDPAQVSGRLLLRFIDPISQKQVLEMALRARRTGEAITARCFVRPSMTLPTRCDVTIAPRPREAGVLCWRFSPVDAPADGPTPPAAVVDAGERAARRIARDLHDEAGQMLAALHLAIDDVSRDLPEPTRSRVHAMRGLVSTVEEQLRRITHEMRPAALEHEGLAAALESLAAGVRGRTRVRVDVDASFRGRLQPHAETHLYRIAQEALTNALRHGTPSRIRVRVARRGEAIVLSVADDGSGFDPSVVPGPGHRGLGLAGVRERVDLLGGSLSIQSRPGKGTTVSITVPLWP